MSNFNLLNSPWQEIFEAFSKGSTAFQLFGATVGIIFFILLISRPILRYLKENDILYKDNYPKVIKQSNSRSTQKIVSYIEKETVGALDSLGEYYESTKIFFSDGSNGEITFKRINGKEIYYCTNGTKVYYKTKEDSIQNLYLKLHRSEN